MLKKKEKTPKEVAAMKKEELTLKRKAHKIHVCGTDIPLHCETYNTISLFNEVFLLL